MRIGRSIVAPVVAHAALDTGVHGVGSDTLGTEEDLTDHAALDTGVHSVGSDTIGTEEDLDTHEALTDAHGSVSAATANRIARRNGNGRAKFAAPAASGEALIKGTRVTVAELPAVTDEAVLVGTGTNMEERAFPTGATKEFFMPVTQATENPGGNDYCGGLIDATNDVARVEFYVPSDFTSIVEAVVARIAHAEATHRLNYATDYGAVGAARNTHSEYAVDVETAEVTDIIYEEDISALLPDLAAGDYVGVRVNGDSENTPNDTILGVRFKYS